MRSVAARLATGSILATALALVAGDAAAQVEIQSRAAEITITGRVQTQFNTTSVDDEIASELLVRRARLTAEIEVSDLVSGKVQPEYGEGDVKLKDAYLRLTFDPGFRASFGQFKRPFDLFELASSTRILVVERAGGVRGVDACTGLSGVCSLSRFTERLEYSDRDIGVMIDGRPGDGPVQYMVSATNGAGDNTSEDNDSKSFSGRLEYTVLEDLVLAGNVGIHDFVSQFDGEDDYGVAFGGDVEWGGYDRGFHVQAGVVAGDNWRNLDAGGDPATFVTAQGILTYRQPLGNHRHLIAIEPVGRVSWGDPDTDADDDEGFLLTPGFVVHFTGRNKVAVNLDIWAPTEGDTEVSVKAQSYLHF